jgi:hypothetical protein
VRDGVYRDEELDGALRRRLVGYRVSIGVRCGCDGLLGLRGAVLRCLVAVGWLVLVRIYLLKDLSNLLTDIDMDIKRSSPEPKPNELTRIL